MKARFKEGQEARTTAHDAGDRVASPQGHGPAR